MFQFIFGFMAGAYTAQKYNIPDIENIISDIFNNMKKLEKNENENENNIENENENKNNKEKKKFKFF